MRLITLTAFNSNSNLNSIESFFPNASWLERETAEMYGIYFFNKNDSRKLLLDYSKNENPLLKNYPVEGYSQVFFSFFENQVVIQNSTSVEL